MDATEYREKVLFNLEDYEYEPIESDSDGFPDVYSKTKTMSTLDAGRERRFIGISDPDGSISVDAVREGIRELNEVAEENVKVANITVGSGGLSSTPTFPVYISENEIDDDVKSTVKGMDSINKSDISVPVLAEIGDGGGLLGGSEVELTYPLPGRRNMPRRRAVKKIVSKVFEV